MRIQRLSKIYSGCNSNTFWKNVFRKLKSYSWVGLLVQPSGPAGGWVRPGGRDICNWFNQYGADLPKNALFVIDQFWPFLSLLDLKNGSGYLFTFVKRSENIRLSHLVEKLFVSQTEYPIANPCFRGADTWIQKCFVNICLFGLIPKSILSNFFLS